MCTTKTSERHRLYTSIGELTHCRKNFKKIKMHKLFRTYSSELAMFVYFIIKSNKLGKQFQQRGR